VPLLGGDVEGVEVEAGADGGGLEVVEREEEADDLLAPGLRGDVERGLPGVGLRGGERGQGGARGLGVGQERADGGRVGGSDRREERLVGERREIHRGFGSGARVDVAAAVTLGARCPA
jgi:hypothetical protein